MNSKSEYNRCSLPRLTAKLGESDYDEKKKLEKLEEKKEEKRVREEIRVRRKERCKDWRGEEEELEKQTHKRRKVGEAGEYKKVLQKSKPGKAERTESDDEGQIQGRERKRRKEDEPYRILGGVIKDHEVWEIDWEKERVKRLEELEQMEKERECRIKKALRLEKSWKLLQECKKTLEDLTPHWKSREERQEERDKEDMRLERVERATVKKTRLLQKIEREKKEQKITELLEKLPKDEIVKLEEEESRWEREEMEEIRDNMWSKRRGKRESLLHKEKIPEDLDKLDEKINRFEMKLKQYCEREEQKYKKLEKKKKLEEHWSMARWLTKYIKKNSYHWERRRRIQREEMERQEEDMRWKKLDHNAQIDEMKIKKAEEDLKMEMEGRRREKARQRRKNWKEWRMPEEDVEEEEGEVQQGDSPELEMIAGLEDAVPKQNKAGKYFPESQPGDAQQGDFPEKLIGLPESQPGGKLREGGRSPALAKEDFPGELIDFPEPQPGGKLRGGGRSPALAKEDFPGKLDLEKELDDFPEDLDQELLEGLPVWSNTPHILSASPEKLGGGDMGWGGAYEEIPSDINKDIPSESIAHHQTGLLNSKEEIGKEDLQLDKDMLDWFEEERAAGMCIQCATSHVCAY